MTTYPQLDRIHNREGRKSDHDHTKGSIPGLFKTKTIVQPRDQILSLINSTTYQNFIKFHSVVWLLLCVWKASMEPASMIPLLTEKSIHLVSQKSLHVVFIASVE